MTLATVDSPPGSTIVAVNVVVPGDRPDRRLQHQTARLVHDPRRRTGDRGDRQRLGVGRQVGDRHHDLIAAEHLERPRRGDRLLVDVDRHPAARTETARVDDRVADDDVAVLALWRRVHAADEAGRTHDIDDRTVRPVRGQIDGDRLSVPGPHEPVVRHGGRLGTRPHVDAQGGGVGQFAVAHLIGEHRRTRAPGVAVKLIDWFALRLAEPSDASTPERIDTCERIAVRVAVVEQHRDGHRAAVDDLGAVIECIRWPVQRLLDGQQDARRRREAFTITDGVRGHDLTDEVRVRRHGHDRTRQRHRGVAGHPRRRHDRQAPRGLVGVAVVGQDVELLRRTRPEDGGGVGNGDRCLVHPFGDRHPQPSERHRSLGVGDLIVDRGIADLVTGDEGDHPSPTGGRSDHRGRRRHQLEVGIAAVGVDVVGEHVDRCGLADLHGQRVEHRLRRLVGDHRLAHRHEDRRRRGQPTGVRHLVGAPERAGSALRRVVSDLTVCGDRRLAARGATGAADEGRSATRRVAVVAQHVDGHRHVDERERRVVAGERWLGQRFGQHGDRDVADHFVPVAVGDRVGEPCCCLALLVDERRRCELDLIAAEHDRLAGVVGGLRNRHHGERVTVGVDVVCGDVDDHRLAGDHLLCVGGDDGRSVRFDVVDHTDQHRPAHDVAVAVVDGVGERRQRRGAGSRRDRQLRPLDLDLEARPGAARRPTASRRRHRDRHR